MCVHIVDIIELYITDTVYWGIVHDDSVVGWFE